jgi:hypothetical protein
MKHKKWPELVPHIQDWLNSSVAETTGCVPIELLDGKFRPDIFRNILKKRSDQIPTEDTVAEKVLKAYARAKVKAEKRNLKRKTGKSQWLPKINDLVLVKSQLISDVVQGVTVKFQRPYEGPYTIQKIVNSSSFEVKDEKGKCRGLFNLRYLKPYLEEKLSANDNQIMEKNVELISKGATEAVAERQQLHIEVANGDTVMSLDDQCLDQQINVRRRRKLKKWTQGNGASLRS